MAEAQEVLSLLIRARYLGTPAFQAVEGDIDSLVKKTSALEKVGSTFNMVGNLMIAGGVAAGIGVAAILKETEKYQQAINRMQSVGAIPQGYTNLVAMSDQIHQATQKYGLDSTQFAEGAYPIVSSLGAVQSQFGLATDSMSLMHAMFQANLLPDLAAYIEASGGGLEGTVSMTDGLQQLHTILSATHVPLQQYGKVMGDLTAVEQHSATLQSQLATALPRALTTTSVANMPYQDVFAAIGAASMSGILGSRAGTEFSSGMRTALTSPTAAKELKALGLNVNDLYGANGQMTLEGVLSTLIPKLAPMSSANRLKAETELFGAVGGRTINPLLNQQGFNQYKYLRNLENGNTVASMQKSASQMANGTPLGQIQQLLTGLKNTAQDVGIALSSPFMALIGHLKVAVQWLDRFAKEFERLPTSTRNKLGELILASPALLLGGGVGMKGIGGLLTMLGKNARLTGVKNDKLQTGYESELSKWQNTVTLGNQRAELAALTDESKKRAAYESDILRYQREQQSVTQGLRRDSNALMNEYHGEMGTIASKYAKEEEGGGLILPQQLAANQTYLRGAARKAEEDLAKSNYLEAHGNMLAGYEARQLASKEPVLSEYLTPFEGSLAAMPLRPQAPEKELSLLARMFSPVTGLGRLAGAGFALPGLALPGARAGLGNLTEGVGSARSGLKAFFADAFAGTRETARFTRGTKSLDEAYGLLEGRGMERNLTNVMEVTEGRHGLGRMASIGGSAIKDVAGIGAKGGGAIIEGVGGALGKFSGLIGGLLGSLPELGGALLGIGSGFMTILLPVLLVVGAIAAIVLAFTKFRAQTMQVVAFLAGALAPTINAVKATFQSFITLITDSWQSHQKDLQGAFTNLMAAVKNLAPLFIIVGKNIGMTATVIGGSIGAVIHVFVAMLPTIINILAGVVNVIADLVKFVVALFTLQWGQIPGIVGDLFGSIFSIIGNFVGLIFGTVGTLVGDIINIFIHLFDILVGHSIIPELVNAIISWIGRLPGALLGILENIPLIGGFIHIEAQVTATVVGLVGNILGIIGSLPSKLMSLLGSALNAAKNVILGPIQGIAQGIANFLAFHSPPPLGPLADSDKWMPNMMHMMGGGVSSNAGALTGPVSNVATTVDSTFAEMQKSATASAALMSKNFSTQVNQMAQNAQKLANSTAKSMEDTYKRMTGPSGKPQTPQGPDPNKLLTIADFQDTAYASATTRYQEYLDGLALQHKLYLDGYKQVDSKGWKTIRDFQDTQYTSAYDQYQTYLNGRLFRLRVNQRLIENDQNGHEARMAALSRKAGEDEVSTTTQTMAKVSQQSHVGLLLLQQQSKRDVNTYTTDLTKAFNTVPDKLAQAGKNAGNAFAQALTSTQLQVIQAASHLADVAVQTVQRGLGIHSPSRVFQDLGHNTVLGFVNGVQSGSGLVKSAYGAFTPGGTHGYGSGVTTPIQVRAMYVEKLYLDGKQINTDGAPMGAGTNGTYWRTTAIQQQRQGVWNQYENPSKQYDLSYRNAYQYTQ